MDGVDEYLRLREFNEGQVSLDHLLNILDDLLLFNRIFVKVLIHQSVTLILQLINSILSDESLVNFFIWLAHCNHGLVRIYFSLSLGLDIGWLSFFFFQHSFELLVDTC